MKRLILTTTFAGIGLQCYYSLNLPPAVANHFGPGGWPNGWMSNSANLTLSGLVLLLVAGLYLAIPFLLHRAPVGMISFPHRKYWLDPSRRARTIPRIANWLCFSGLLTLLFLLSVYHLVYLANLSTPPRLDQPRFMAVFIGYLASMLAWIAALLVKFGRKPR